jgi:hypothetical protein
MTGEQIRIAQQLAKKLQKLAGIAADNELTLPNGGDVASMLYGIAVDIEWQASAAEGKKEGVQ